MCMCVFLWFFFIFSVLRFYLNLVKDHLVKFLKYDLKMMENSMPSRDQDRDSKENGIGIIHVYNYSQHKIISGTLVQCSVQNM